MIDAQNLKDLLEEFGQGDPDEFVTAVDRLVDQINAALLRLEAGKGKAPSKVNRERAALLDSIENMDRRLRHWIIERELECGMESIGVLHRLAGLLRDPIPSERVWFDDEREVAMTIVAAFCKNWGLSADVDPDSEVPQMEKYTGFFELMTLIKPELNASWDTYKLLPIFRPKLARLKHLG